MKRIVTGFIGATCLALSMGASAANFIFTYGHSQPENTPRTESMEWFKQELEQRTDGQIRVENYYSAMLGTEREMMDMVATGAMQGFRGGLFTDANQKYQLFMLPFVVSDWDEVSNLVESDIAHRLNREAQDNGFHIPAIGISMGFRAYTNNVRPIKMPDDLKGLNMRVSQQEAFLALARALEVNPMELPDTEIYQALRLGVIDGQDNPPANIAGFKIHEVQKYMTVTNFTISPDPFIVSLPWYQSLPENLQQTFDEVAREAITLSDRLNREQEEGYIQMMADSGVEVTYLTEESRQLFREKVQPVYDYFLERGIADQDDIEEIIEAAKQS